MVNQLLNPKTIEKNILAKHKKDRHLYLLRTLLFIIFLSSSFLLYAEEGITMKSPISSLTTDTIPIPLQKDTLPKAEVIPSVDTAKSGQVYTVQQAAVNKSIVSDTIPSTTGAVDSVRGTVRDDKGKPVANAAVTIKGKEMSFAADSSGRYSVAVAPGAVLIISAVGHRSQEVLVTSAKKVYDAVLIEEAASLEEVVVTALGIERSAKDLVYATQTVKTSELIGIRDPSNVINSLQGKVANAVITQGSGGPGSGARMVLRGNRSIQGANTALIVIDGVPMANPTYTTPGSTFGGIQGPDGASNINPDDIESVTILRGASAAALYGSQAGNGVMVITTKKGKKGKYEVSFNSGLTFEKPFALPAVQNKYGQGLGGKMDPAVGDSWGAPMSGQSYTNLQGTPSQYSAQPDNIRDFFQTGTSFNNSISIAGGSEKMQTYFSYTNNSQTGIVPKNKLGRHTFNVRVNNQITDRLSSDVKMTYITQNIKNIPRTGEENAPVMDIYQIPRNTSLAEIRNYQMPDSNGMVTMIPTPWSSTLSSIYQNPYWMVHNTAVDVGRDRIMGFVSLKYDLTDWLNVTARANLDQIKDEMEQRYTEGSILYTNAGAGGDLIITKSETTQKWYDLIFSGNNNVGENWKINYNVGAIYRDVIGESSNVRANGLNLVNAFRINFAKNPLNTASTSGTTTQSLFGQATIGFKDAIFFDGSYRNDWDSRLPAPYSYGYYSAGTSVIFSDLFKLPKSINFLKGFVSYAEVGNGGREQIRQVTYNYAQGVGNGKVARTTTYPIENLKPEIVKNWEGGIEVRFLENRLGFAATVYKSNSINQLLTLALPAATGFSNQYINAGNIQNKGLEITLQGTPIKKERFNWDVAFNYAMNRNKVIKLSDALKFVYINSDERIASVALEEGGSYGDLYALKWDKDVAGNYLVNEGGKPILTSKTGVVGNFNPKATLGFTNTFEYDNFSLRVLADGRVGGTIISGTEMNLAFSGISEVTEMYRDGGLMLGGVNAEGEPVNKAITAQDFWQTASGKRYGAGEFFAYDATSFRLRELSLGYKVPLKDDSFIRNLRVSVVARNLFWLYRGSSTMDIPSIGKRKMWFDPDMSLSNSNYQGVEYGTLPSTRSWGLNIQLGF